MNPLSCTQLHSLYFCLRTKLKDNEATSSANTLEFIFFGWKRKNIIVPCKRLWNLAGNVGEIWPQQRSSSCVPPVCGIRVWRRTTSPNCTPQPPSPTHPPTPPHFFSPWLSDTPRRCIVLSDFIAFPWTLLLLLQDGIITIKHISSSSIISRLLKIIAS